MASTCEISGNSDMYGLGIRIGFYLQWLSSPIAAWIAASEASGIRTANALFVSATLIGLIIETTLNNLDVIEIYIILLLGFGVQYFWLLGMLWSVVTCFNANLDPSRFMKTPTPSTTFWFFFSLVQVAQIIFQLWFWIYKIPRTKDECQRFGFAFFKVRLTSHGFQIFNIIVMVALLVLTVALFALRFRRLWRQGRISLWNNASPVMADEVQEKELCCFCGLSHPFREKDDQHSQQEKRETIFCIIETVFRVTSISVVILATELTISWNDIQGVDNAKSVGQLIPLMIGVSGVMHLLLAASRAKSGVSCTSKGSCDEIQLVPTRGAGRVRGGGGITVVQQEPHCGIVYAASA